MNSPRRLSIVAVSAVAGIVLEALVGLEGAFFPALLVGLVVAMLVPSGPARCSLPRPRSEPPSEAPPT